jgi:ubiquinone/menaquinone biosynthesis C-methylase UbiE
MKLCLNCGTSYGNTDWQCPACAAVPQRRSGFKCFAPDAMGDGRGFDPVFFKELANLESGNFWFRGRNRLIVWALKHWFPKATSLLEVGCGTGFVLSGIAKALPDMTLVGSELYFEGLAIAAEKVPTATFLQMDATLIPFDREFDVVGAFDMLEHIERDDLVLEQLYRATVPGGGIMITVPQHPSLWSKVDEYAKHVRRYRGADLEKKVSQAGFRVVMVTSFVSVLLPFMYLSRLNARAKSASFDPLSELRLPRLLNWGLGSALAIEEFFIRCGLRLPAGGSLLLVAVKTEAL